MIPKNIVVRSAFVFFSVFLLTLLFAAVLLSRRFGISAAALLFFPFLLGAFLFFALSVALNRRFKNRLSSMAQAATHYVKGNFSKPIPVDHEDELDVLIDAMNHMAAAFNRALAGVQVEKNQFSAILNHMTEGVLGIGHDGEVLIANRSAERILGLTPGWPIGKSLLEVLRSPQADEMMQLVIAEQTHRSIEIEVTFPHRKILRANGVAVGQDEERICGILVFYDITEVRNLENTRKEFVANVSHELRTPLTSIKGFIETLLGGALQDRQRSESFLRIMQEDTERLTRLIDDILDLSKLDSKEAPLKIEPLDMRQEIEKVIQLVDFKLEEKKIKTENRVPENTRVFADRDKLKQVLLNLTDNAIKFNRHSGRIIFESHKTGSQTVEISLEDTGIGIPEKAVPRIFERFFRVDKARAREAGGTGLGLAIVKHIIELHGGEVSCKSDPGAGSRFSFTLKIAPEA